MSKEGREVVLPTSLSKHLFCQSSWKLLFERQHCVLTFEVSSSVPTIFFWVKTGLKKWPPIWFQITIANFELIIVNAHFYVLFISDF